MSSRGGPRAAGTDGSDFSHRERVASHYRESVRNKLKVKVCIWTHLFLVSCVAAWIGLSLAKQVELVPEQWTMIWCTSAIPAFIGLSAIPKNKQTSMYLYSFGIILAGIGPLIYGASILANKVLTNFSNGMVPATLDWRVLPVEMAIIAFVIQLHAISVFYASKLISAWGAKGEKGS